jgi:hypothetical protein
MPGNVRVRLYRLIELTCSTKSKAAIILSAKTLAQTISKKIIDTNVLFFNNISGKMSTTLF